MKREGCVGYCDTTGGWFRPRNFEIEIDTHLDKETYTKTLLHEMFHMKQFIDGTLKTKWSKMYYKNEPVDNYDYKINHTRLLPESAEETLYKEYHEERLESLLLKRLSTI